MERFRFVDRTGADAPRQRPTRPVVIPKEAIEEEVRRLASLPAPANGRRESLIANPEAGVGDALAPGISVTLSVLKPGERTRPIRHNSAVACFSIDGAGEAVVGARRIRFGRYDVWTIPSWTTYQNVNDGDRLQVRLTYSNAALLEKLNVHVAEDDPPLEAPPAEPAEGARGATAAFPLRGGSALLMPYEKLIHPDVVAREAL
ncbi:MAG: gentisate 1,2-dioxygenase, partial [Candidatus Binatia bacterium]